jgi:hypothetical protein
MKKRPARTVMEVACARAGVLKGARVVAFICQWTMASQALGHAITLEEYRAWWKESERTAYRYQREFRDVFPHLATPQPFADQAIVRAEALSHGVNGLGKLQLDALPGLALA